MGVLDRQRERGAQLVAVERAMAAAAHPARALQRPIARPRRLARPIGTGLVAAEAGAARPEICPAAEAPEAEALVRHPNGAVRIALARGDRVAQSGNQHVAHLDVAHQPLRRAVRQSDVDAHDRRPALAQAELHLLVAGAAHLSRRPAAVVEAP